MNLAPDRFARSTSIARSATNGFTSGACAGIQLPRNTSTCLFLSPSYVIGTDRSDTFCRYPSAFSTTPAIAFFASTSDQPGAAIRTSRHVGGSAACAPAAAQHTAAAIAAPDHHDRRDRTLGQIFAERRFVRQRAAQMRNEARAVDGIGPGVARVAGRKLDERRQQIVQLEGGTRRAAVRARPARRRVDRRH